ncbi:MAG: HNH endonuclease [Spirochaetes bacterium]|nr:HNH endonuclease [Spirochaetota bacterium]
MKRPKKKDSKFITRERRTQRKNKYRVVDLYERERAIIEEKKKARSLRRSLWWKETISEGKCYYCGRIFNPSDLTMDHKIPLAKGGKSEKTNIAPACKECNNRKKYFLPTEWETNLKS